MDSVVHEARLASGIETTHSFHGASMPKLWRTILTDDRNLILNHFSANSLKLDSNLLMQGRHIRRVFDGAMFYLPKPGFV